MKFILLLTLGSAVLVAAQQASFGAPTAGEQTRPADIGRPRTAAPDKPTADSTAAKMLLDIRSDADHERQRQQFEAVLQGLANDVNLRHDRERMQNDLRGAQANVELHFQARSLEADLKQAETSIERNAELRKLEGDVDAARKAKQE